MSVYQSYLSVVTRASGYAIAVVRPKDDTHAVLGSSQFDGPYDPLHLLGYTAGLWEAAVNQPRARQGLHPIGPHCLLCNHDADIDLINQMLKQTGGSGAFESQQFDVAVPQVEAALQSIRHQVETGRLVVALQLLEQIHIGLASVDSLDPHTDFSDVSLKLAAILQVIAYEQAGASRTTEAIAQLPERLAVDMPSLPPPGWFGRFYRWLKSG
ncbi:MAG: hypothetical protein AAFR42_02760 [Cyanobacteria bacterium J06628_6]